MSFGIIMTRAEIEAEIERHEQAIRAVARSRSVAEPDLIRQHRQQRDLLVGFLQTIDSTEPF
jgi:hypothetical protein